MKVFFKYVIFALLTSILNVGIYYFLHEFLIASIIICNVIAYIVSLLLSFIVNKKFVFHNQAKSKRALLKYTGVKLSALVIDSIILIILEKHLLISSLIAKITANSSTTISNYFLNKYFVFPKKESYAKER